MNYGLNNLQAVITNSNTNDNKPVTKVIDLATLDSMEVAGTVTKAIPFAVTCAIKGGVAIFFAQLKGGKRFAVTPVMPKDKSGVTLAPPNGEQGFLTVEISENAELTETEGKLEFSVRPVFNDWETVEAHKAKAAKDAKGTK